jgi:hypothetical protein
MVYIKVGGGQTEAYHHKADCRYLRHVREPRLVRLAYAVAAHLHPCVRCDAGAS